jgi:hypothetical protein
MTLAPMLRSLNDAIHLFGQVITLTSPAVSTLRSSQRACLAGACNPS